MSRHRFLFPTVFAALSVCTARAAYPLIVDDAAAHPPGEFQFDFVADAARFPAADALGANFLLTAGLLPRLEGSVGTGFGWTRNRTIAGAPTRDGILDLTVGLKSPILLGDRAPFTLTLSAFAKLPTASTRVGLGTGFTDTGILAIATRSWEAWSLDVNAGFTFTAVGQRSAKDGDAWFAGMALRWQISKPLMLFAETFGVFPTAGATEPTGTARAGCQFEVRPGSLLGSAIGAGFGSKAATALGTLGLTIIY